MKDLSLGFIALFRQFLKWEWFTDVNTCHFMVYCLLRANKQAVTWRGQKIKRGQFISSLNNMSNETGLTISQIRTCINKLSKTGEIANETSNQNSIITVKNYNEYQGINKRIARILAKEIANENRQYNRVLPKPIANDLARDLATNNNIYKDTNNIYNISLSNKEKITKDEREILINYVKRKKLAKSSVRAYVNAIIERGDYIDILKEEKERIEKLKTQKKLQAEIIPPEIEEKSSPEDEKRGLELLRNTVKKIRKGQK